MDKKSLLTKMKVLYEKHNDMDFDIYRKNLQEEIPKGIDIKTIISKTIRPTKRRWKKNVLSGKNVEFNNEMEYVASQFKKAELNEIDKEKVKDYFKAKSIEEYKEKILLKIEKWNNDDNQYLCEFSYINNLSKRSVTTAIKYDLIIMNENNNNKNVEIPTILPDIPIDYTGRVDYLDEKQKENLIESPITKLDKIVSLKEDEQERLIMELERDTFLAIKQGANPNKYVDMMAKIALIKSIKYLNSFDVKVIIYFYSFKNIMKGEAIDKGLYEILTDLGLPANGKYYNLLVNSFAKLGSLTLTFDDGPQIYRGSLLSDIGIYIDEKSNTKRVKVSLGSLLKSVSRENFVLEIDREFYEELSNFEKQIAIWLQKRRYKLVIAGHKLEEKLPMAVFNNSIYFGTKRKSRIRESIKEALKNIQKKEKIITDQSYDNKLDIAYVKYKELSIKEINMLSVDVVENNNIIKSPDIISIE